MTQIPLADLQPLSFRVKEFDYSRYYMDGPDIQGAVCIIK